MEYFRQARDFVYPYLLRFYFTVSMKNSFIQRYEYNNKTAWKDFNTFWSANQYRICNCNNEDECYYKIMLYLLIQYTYHHYIEKEYPKFIQVTIFKLGL